MLRFKISSAYSHLIRRFKIWMVEKLLLINLRIDEKYIFEFQSRTVRH